MKVLVTSWARLMQAGVFTALIACMLALPALGSAEAGDEAVAGDATAPVATASPAPAPSVYRISPGDVLSINVVGEEQFTRDCPVNSAGTISYPYLNDVQARGLTCREFEGQLSERLKKYINEPRVTVTVSEYGPLGMSIFVLGEVKNQGMYPLATGTGLRGALAAAGGPTDLAGGVVTIAKVRTGEILAVPLEEALAGSPASDEAVVEPGDFVVVGRSAAADEDRRYSVLGEVPNPGMYDMPRRETVLVLDAMEKAGLLSRSGGSENPGAPISLQERFPTADFENALLTRDEVVVPLNLVALLQGDTGQNIPLMPGDVLTIPRRSLVSVYALGEVAKTGRQLIPTGLKVLDLLNAAGGVTSAADLGGASIMRLVEGEPTPVPVDLGRLLKSGDAEQNRVLQDGDVLYVPTRGQRSSFWQWLPIVPYLLRH